MLNKGDPGIEPLRNLNNNARVTLVFPICHASHAEILQKVTPHWSPQPENGPLSSPMGPTWV
jgi:hypothetical protein